MALGFLRFEVGVRLGFIPNILAVCFRLLADAPDDILAMLGFSRGGHFRYREGAASRAPFFASCPCLDALKLGLMRGRTARQIYGLQVHQSASAHGRQKGLEVHGFSRPRIKCGFASQETLKARGRGGGSCALFGVSRQ